MPSRPLRALRLCGETPFPPARKSRAKLCGKPQIPSTAIHNIVAKSRVLRGKTGAVVAPFCAEVAHRRMKMGRFALHVESSRPENHPGALETRLRPKKNARKSADTPKKIFWNFRIFCTGGSRRAGRRGRYGRNSRVIIFFLPMVKSTHPAESIARSATGISSRVVSRILRHGLSLGSGRANSA